MITHTKAFLVFRTLSQAHINFAVLVCHAVPALRADLSLSSIMPTNPPDHFKTDRTPKSEVARYVSSYQDELARVTVNAVFSYFEAYIKDALMEIVEFHGSEAKIKSMSVKRNTKFISSLSPDVRTFKRKLQDNPTSAKMGKYQKYGKFLDQKGYRFPTDLFANFGLYQLMPKLKDDRTGMRAWEIPNMLQECLLFPITSVERKVFEEIRTLRNKIAHGKPPSVTLKKSLHYASLLHTLAAKVDNHITEHFLIVEAI
jgi:hypothetical protein